MCVEGADLRHIQKLAFLMEQAHTGDSIHVRYFLHGRVYLLGYLTKGEWRTRMQGHPGAGEMVEGASKAQLTLLSDISGAFRPGVLTCLMGVSGAGKTTLLDLLAGRKTGVCSTLRFFLPPQRMLLPGETVLDHLPVCLSGCQQHCSTVLLLQHWENFLVLIKIEYFMLIVHNILCLLALCDMYASCMTSLLGLPGTVLVSSAKLVTDKTLLDALVTVL